jgi:hypothetical protein
VIPVVSEDKEQLVGLSSISLYYNCQCVAVLHKPEFYSHSKEERGCRQSGNCYRDQPYIKVKSLHESKI